MSTWQEISFETAFSDITSKAFKIDQSEFLQSGEFPIIDQGQQFIAGYFNDERLVWEDDLPVVIFGDHTRILKYVDFPFVLGADGTKVLKPNKEILPLFAYYELLSFNIPSAGYSRHFKFLKDFTFRYPSLPEQRRIASLLSRADHLRRLRRYSDSLSASLLQSVFLEMFGNLKRNKGNFEYELVDDICELVRGSSPRPQGDPKLFGGSVPRLMVADITRDGMLVTPIIDSLTELGAKQSRPMKAGEVVMVVSGAVGLPAILKIDACIHDGFVGFRDLDRRIMSVYFYSFLLSMQKQNHSQAAGAIWQNLTTDQIKEWKIPLPPLPQQEQFAAVVRRVEALRARQKESARQGQALFQSLLTQSFGEGLQD